MCDDTVETEIEVLSESDKRKGESYIIRKEYHGLLTAVLSLGEINQRFSMMFDDKVGFVCTLKKEMYEALLEKVEKKKLVTIIFVWTYKNEQTSINIEALS